MFLNGHQFFLHPVPVHRKLITNVGVLEQLLLFHTINHSTLRNLRFGLANFIGTHSEEINCISVISIDKVKGVNYYGQRVNHVGDAM